MRAGYAVIDPEGELQGVEGSVSAAVESAGRFAQDVSVEVARGPEQSLSGFGDVGGASMAQHALQKSGLSVIDGDAVMRMSLSEAHQRLMPLFAHFPARLVSGGAGTRGQGGRMIPAGMPAQYKTAAKMRDAWLGQNYKTAKVDDEAVDESTGRPFPLAQVLGLSLLPFTMGEQLSKRQLSMNWCVGSSKACQSSCLVYSGKNPIDYNLLVKVARTEALMLETTAFARMLVEALGQHFQKAPEDGYVPYVRLNVFQDIPWELVFPDLFSMFDGGNFYDYTKVAGRETPQNYDLTFSYSGANMSLFQREIEHRRGAVVFVLPGNQKAEPVFPDFFMDRLVVSGENSDVRPRDPEDAIVGLRWKNPLDKGRARAERQAGKATAFVVKVEEIEGVLVAAESSRASTIVDADLEEA